MQKKVKENFNNVDELKKGTVETVKKYKETVKNVDIKEETKKIY